MKITRYIHRAFVLIISLFLYMPLSSLADTGLLDGRIYTGMTGEVGKDSDGEDELRFADNTLFSVGCAEWGFEKGSYSATQDGDQVNFKAVLMSPDDGTIVWEGLISGNAIEATYTWTKERWWWFDGYKESWFKGRLKN